MKFKSFDDPEVRCELTGTVTSFLNIRTGGRKVICRICGGSGGGHRLNSEVIVMRKFCVVRLVPTMYASVCDHRSDLEQSHAHSYFCISSEAGLVGDWPTPTLITYRGGNSVENVCVFSPISARDVSLDFMFRRAIEGLIEVRSDVRTDNTTESSNASSNDCVVEARVEVLDDSSQSAVVETQDVEVQTEVFVESNVNIGSRDSVGATADNRDEKCIRAVKLVDFVQRFRKYLENESGSSRGSHTKKSIERAIQNVENEYNADGDAGNEDIYLLLDGSPQVEILFCCLLLMKFRFKLLACVYYLQSVSTERSNENESKSHTHKEIKGFQSKSTDTDDLKIDTPLSIDVRICLCYLCTLFTFVKICSFYSFSFL